MVFKLGKVIAESLKQPVSLLIYLDICYISTFTLRNVFVFCDSDNYESVDSDSVNSQFSPQMYKGLSCTPPCYAFNVACRTKHSQHFHMHAP